MISEDNNPASSPPGFSARHVLVLLFLAALSLGGYLLVAHWEFRGAFPAGFFVGFPLDDAWIHQTYARNLALEGQWSFVIGRISAGSTSPLWSALLAPGYLLHLSPFPWTFALSWLLLAAVAGVSALTFRVLSPQYAHLSWLAAMLFLFEWHLVWAAGSGMETLLYSTIVLLALFWLLKGPISWIGLGALVGLSAWVRPDGITLLGPALMVIALRRGGWRLNLRAGLSLALGFILLFAPYLAFNQALAGAWWPNTFFAKQAEYAILRQQPLLLRFLQQAELPLIGVGIVLLPGFIYRLGLAIRCREWAVLAGALWFLGYLGLYAWRLPVTYQHGRYVIPAMPVYLLWSFAGAVQWIDLHAVQMLRRVVGRAWAIMVAAVLLGFWFLGARSYAMDVGFIESQMVETAHWVTRNTPVNSLIAVHDIGAMGFFGKRDLVDLAGLVSPDVIPFIRDENRLSQYLNHQEVDYLVTFPDWYPQLVRGRQKLYCGPQNKYLAGMEPMCVYLWK
jgi:arabinofuranosyltransferase